MKIENVVKVMNFHSLLRVDSSKKNAEKFFEYEKALNEFTDNILNNRNLLLDKKLLQLDKNARPLNIYIGNDLGFCGNFNTNVSTEARRDENCDKIIIGKKIIKNNQDGVLLAITKEEYKENIKEIERILYDAITNRKNSEINVVYNHYFNISKIELTRKRLLPLPERGTDKKTYKEDFAVEGDINDILINIIVLYLLYEIRIATENSFASENIMRQAITKESLKKIEEIEEENERMERKIRKNINFKKTLENLTNVNNKDG